MKELYVLPFSIINNKQLLLMEIYLSKTLKILSLKIKIINIHILFIYIQEVKFCFYFKKLKDIKFFL